MRRGFESGAVAAAVVLAACAAAGCGAPPARPAEGPVADDVRAALDSGRASFRHGEWDALLAGGTREGLVDYRFFQRRRAELEGYLDRLARAELAELAPRHLEALLINAYNALTIRVILEHPAVSSIRQIDGVWTRLTHPVGGHDLTLDQIEHNLLRPFFRDPRVHFVLNCASRSCAPLPPYAFTGDELEQQLEERTEAFLSDPAHVRVQDGTLLLSRYFDWYGEDFVSAEWEPRAPTIPEFVAPYARDDVAAFIRAHENPPIRFLDYDWSLNAAVPPDPPARASGASQGQPPPAAEVGEEESVGAASVDAEPPSGSGLVAGLRRWVAGFGAAAPLVYGVAYAVAVVLLVPGSALTIGAGVAFGLGTGLAVVAVAATTGAAAAFLLARHLLRRRVARWLRGRPKLTAVDRAVEREGWKVVALTRLSPAFPFNVQNYFYGLTGVGFVSYLLASALAMLPGTLLYVYIGSAGAELVSAATGAADLGRTLLQVAGLLATVAVVVLVARVARRELERLAGEPLDDSGRAADARPTDDTGPAAA